LKGGKTNAQKGDVDSWSWKRSAVELRIMASMKILCWKKIMVVLED